MSVDKRGIVLGKVCSSKSKWNKCKKEKSSKKMSRKIKMSTPLVETRARRSPRIRSRNAGFKHTSCNSRNCLACAAVPPTTTKAMVAIGEDFCKISKEKLSEATLRTKPPTANLIGDKRGASSKRQKGNESIKEVEEGECSATGRRTEN
uniref:Uncharacterized protein n=1 Tax=Setaria viridis TaxID=4556 RepID=A0A4U6VNI0_SETVI|nr:hypothetical protein SEVIR_2G023200v2 [Setaria viridis]